MFSSPACAEGDMDKFPDINTLLDQIMKACTAELLVLSVSADIQYKCTSVGACPMKACMYYLIWHIMEQTLGCS